MLNLHIFMKSRVDVNFQKYVWFWKTTAKKDFFGDLCRIRNISKKKFNQNFEMCATFAWVEIFSIMNRYFDNRILLFWGPYLKFDEHWFWVIFWWSRNTITLQGNFFFFSKAMKKTFKYLPNFLVEIFFPSLAWVLIEQN